MKRFVLILRICVPLVILMALILPGCSEQYVNHVSVSKSTVVVGEKVGLSIKSEDFGLLGCSKDRDDVEWPGNMFGWSVEPSNGAMVKNGMFVASKPGTYIVSPENGPAMGEGSTNVPATIEVEGKEAETSAADTTATKATTATTAKTAETTAAEVTTATTAKTAETTAEETSTETDPNLIHGVVPIKVTAHGYFCKYVIKESEGKPWITIGTIDWSFEFWNVGKLGGDEFSKVTLNPVFNPVDDSYKKAWPILRKTEGIFSGGPNGEMSFVATNTTVLYKLIDGLKISIPASIKSFYPANFELTDSIPIDNPEAFKGWID